MTSSTSTTTPVTAPKLKAYLEHIKNEFLQGQNERQQSKEEYDDDLRSNYLALLRMELVQRGILVTPTSSTPSTSSSILIQQLQEILLVSIQSIAGKPLLDLGAGSAGGGGGDAVGIQQLLLPKPLLAGAAAIAGRIAENVYQQAANAVAVANIETTEIETQQQQQQYESGLSKRTRWNNLWNVSMDQQQQQQQNATSTTTTPSTLGDTTSIHMSLLLQSTMERCINVEEKRLLALIKLGMMMSSSSNKNPSSWTEDEHIIRQQQQQIKLLYIAESYYYRATRFQLDNTPMMWKRIWDVILERKKLQYHHPFHYYNNNNAVVSSWEAITALQQLLHIAESKGNIQRAIVLRLEIAECYLDNSNDDDPKALFLLSTATPPTTTTTLSKNNYIANEDQYILQTFLEPYRPIIPPTLDIACKGAWDTIYEATTGNLYYQLTWNEYEQDHQEIHFLRYILELVIHLKREEATINEIAQNEYQLAKNRIAEAGSNLKQQQNQAATTIAPSLDKIQHSVRQRQLISSGKNDPIDLSAIRLRDMYFSMRIPILVEDTVTSTTTTTAAAASSSRQEYRRQQTNELLLQFLKRRKDQAQAIAMSKSRSDSVVESIWLALADFIHPFLIYWCTNQLHWDLSSSLLSIPTATEQRYAAIRSWLTNIRMISEMDIQLIQFIVTQVPIIEWMCCSIRNGKQVFPIIVQQLCHDILYLLQEQIIFQRQQQQQQQISSNEVISSMDPLEFTLYTIECSLATLKAFLFLQNPISTRVVDQVNCRQWIDTAISRNSILDKFPELMSQTGFGFLDCICCWDGLLCFPWSFCTLSEARTILSIARTSLQRAYQDWGRISSTLELCILDLAEAHMASLLLTTGGSYIIDKAKENYQNVITLLNTQVNAFITRDVLISICQMGLVKVHFRDQSYPNVDLVNVAVGSLQRLQSLHPSRSSDANSETLYLWQQSSAMESIIHYQIASSRQLIADMMLRVGRIMDAQPYLEDAFRDAPLDANVAFALGSYRLRMMMFFDATNNKMNEMEKVAQLQLLKAAKLDPTKASPFALLGYWYEKVQDTNRAISCYTKALQLDPSHPVAGRGLLRLQLTQLVQPFWTKAIETGSSVIGWAWHAVGLQKSMVDGNDDLAVVAFLRALRCRDIEYPELESLGCFFATPFAPKYPNRVESSGILVNLAKCYRRLGRFTASIRSFHTAIQEGGKNIPSHVFCSCAEVEMELGLFDDASMKFVKALENPDAYTRPIAAYGMGMSLLSIAHRNLQVGKAGSAYALILSALEICTGLPGTTSSCMLKLAGDLHTFGAMLPPDVFILNNSGNIGDAMKLQIDFVAMGETFYVQAEQTATVAISGVTAADRQVLRASIITDLGINKLVQAQLLAMFESRGLNIKARATNVDEAFERSATMFREALELCPTYAPAWCGLGCATEGKDPLLAQHAFCRSLELEHMFPDAYANLCFLYTQRKQLTASEIVSDALTQVADTPMMWINRAMVLEHKARLALTGTDFAESIRQAADGYRASLQVTKHPSALLGLAMTCRMSHSSQVAGRLESSACMSLYRGLIGPFDVPTNILNGVLLMEQFTATAASDALVSAGRHEIRQGLDCLGDDNPLDVASIQSLLVSSNSDVRTTSNSDSIHALSLDQQMIHEPDRGDLWVCLAKQLALEAASQDPTTKRETTQTALTAVRQGWKILSQQLSVSSTSKSRTAIASSKILIPAEVVSEALAVKYWLESLDENSSPSSIELQRSLLLYPGNQLAREALKQTTGARI